MDFEIRTKGKCLFGRRDIRESDSFFLTVMALVYINGGISLIDSNTKLSIHVESDGSVKAGKVTPHNTNTSELRPLHHSAGKQIEISYEKIDMHFKCTIDSFTN